MKTDKLYLGLYNPDPTQEPSYTLEDIERYEQEQEDNYIENERFRQND